jgi:DNA-binding beta-propeller fold protein YncE
MGCAGPGAPFGDSGGMEEWAERTATPVSDYQLAWPAPPAEVRIRFVEEFAIPNDLGIGSSGFRKFIDALAGEKPTGMVRPYAISAEGHKILVADPGLRAVHYFDRRKGAYRLFDNVNGLPLLAPVGVAASEHRVFIADSVAGKVFMLDWEGNLQGEIGSLKRPTSLAYDHNTRRLFVADTLDHRIYVYDESGEAQHSFGERGIEQGQFNFPSHIHFADGQLLVNDNMNFRIQAFDGDGRFLSSFGHHGDGSGYFSQPKGVCTDSEGHVYVAGATIDRVQIFSPEGQFMLAFGSMGNGPGQFVMPTGLTVDEDRIYVADSHNSRVQVFQYVPKQ